MMEKKLRSAHKVVASWQVDNLTPQQDCNLFEINMNVNETFTGQHLTYLTAQFYKLGYYEN